MQSVPITTNVRCVFESRSWRGVLDTTLCESVSDLRQVCGFLWLPPPIKLTHDITEILLKVALNTITPTLYSWFFFWIILYAISGSNLFWDFCLLIKCTGVKTNVASVKISMHRNWKIIQDSLKKKIQHAELLCSFIAIEKYISISHTKTLYQRPVEK